MGRERHDFKLSGPAHLATVNWSDSGHKRCVTASLVQGVYVQKENQKKGPKAQDEKWWSFFKFKLLHHLYDTRGSIFGSVYEWSENAAGVCSRPAGAPKIVVAFRGTAKTSATDLCLDFHILMNRLNTTSRLRMGFDAVKANGDTYGYENVWIAGHSLGAAIGMLAGQMIAEAEGRFLESHFFNPPFISAPLEWIKSEKIKRGLYCARSVMNAALAATLLGKEARVEAQRTFSVLQRWVPCLYVNPKDDLCSGYLGYFRNQREMKEKGASRIANLAAPHSIPATLLSAFGKEAKAGHLIPSATLFLNRSSTSVHRLHQCLTSDHRLHQWWAADINIERTEIRPTG